jgi:hypothetical protein
MGLMGRPTTIATPEQVSAGWTFFNGFGPLGVRTVRVPMEVAEWRPDGLAVVVDAPAELEAREEAETREAREQIDAMADTPFRATWHGKDIRGLSLEELIEVLGETALRPTRPHRRLSFDP